MAAREGGKTSVTVSTELATIEAFSFFPLVAVDLVLVIEAGVVPEDVIVLDQGEDLILDLAQRNAQDQEREIVPTNVPVIEVVASLAAARRASHLLGMIVQGLAASLKRKMKLQVKMENQLSVKTHHISLVAGVILMRGQDHRALIRVPREMRR